MISRGRYFCITTITCADSGPLNNSVYLSHDLFQIFKHGPNKKLTPSHTASPTRLDEQKCLQITKKNFSRSYYFLLNDLSADFRCSMVFSSFKYILIRYFSKLCNLTPLIIDNASYCLCIDLNKVCMYLENVYIDIVHPCKAGKTWFYNLLKITHRIFFKLYNILTYLP